MALLLTALTPAVDVRHGKIWLLVVGDDQEHDLKGGAKAARVQPGTDYSGAVRTDTDSRKRGRRA